MTNDLTTQQPTGQRPLEEDLTRTRDGAILGGVAGGLSRRLGISSSWIRLGFIITTFFGGLGVLLYLVGWVAIPQEGAEKSIAEDFLARRSGTSGWIGIGLIVVAVAVLMGAADLINFQLALAAALLLAGFLLYRGQTGQPAPGGATPPDDGSPTGPPPTPTSAVPPAEPGRAPEVTSAWVSPVVETYRDPGDLPVDVPVDLPVDVSTTDTIFTPPVAPPPPPVIPARPYVDEPPPMPPPAPRRPSSYLGRLTMAIVLITIGVMALLQNLGIIDPQLRDYVASGVLVVGAGLLIGTFFGRARGLILVGLLAVPLLVASTAVRIPLGGEWGQQSVIPTSSGQLQLDGEYQHGVGQFTLDLSQIVLAEDTSVSVEQGIGELRVLVPAGMSVSIDAELGAGQIDLLGSEVGGFDITKIHPGIPGEPTLDLSLDLGTGRIAVLEK